MSLLRYTWLAVGLLVFAGASPGATPKEIETAIQKGTAFIKGHFDNGTKPGKLRGQHGIGSVALSGLALLENGIPPDDAAVKTITAAVRDAAIKETQTYHLTLCLLYLDRLGDSADVPLIQMLGVRLLAGQNFQGGWTYQCIDSVAPGDERLLRSILIVTELKAGAEPAPEGKKGAKAFVPAAGKLHPEIEKYAHKLAAGRRNRGDDNSNTQFGVLGVWAARKHGVPVEHALELIEKRFLATQVNGGWPYSGGGPGSPSMTCAGLLGLATAIGRREERRLKAELPKQNGPFARTVPKETAQKQKPVIDDPFYNPPAAAKEDAAVIKIVPDGKKGAGKRTPADPRDAAVQRAFASLAEVLAETAKQQREQIRIGDRGLGNRDFYFYWSIERVGVVYGVDRIGGIDWYDLGADELIPVQRGDGSWGSGGRSLEVETSFALLFLARSNLVRDLSSKVQKDASNAELRAGAGPRPADPVPEPAPMPASPSPTVAAPALAIRPPAAAAPATPSTTVVVDPKTVAAELVAASDGDWDGMLEKVRDAKGTAHTQALLTALRKLEGDRLRSARAALAERLTRMTDETLRTMAQDKDAELRRGAVLAMAMKDDKSHVPDLIAALVDDDEAVVRAAKAGLKSLTGEDFGPAPGASLAERTRAARAWLEWLRKPR